MSLLPPAGDPIKQNAAPNDVQQYTRNDVERRKGVERRVLESSGGRRQGPAERRKDFTPMQQPASNPEPVHVVDAGGRLQSNPNANVQGVTDIERLASGMQTGAPLASPEAGGRNIPDAGIVVPTKVDAASKSREDGAALARARGEDVQRPADQDKVAEERRIAEENGLVGDRKLTEHAAYVNNNAVAAEEAKASGAFKEQFAQRGVNRRVSQRRVVSVPVQTERRVAISDRRLSTTG